MTRRFVYTGIRVRNLKRSTAFYRKVMGMKVVLRGKMTETKNGGTFVHLVSPRSTQRLELNWYPRGNEYYCAYHDGEALDHLAFWVDDVKKRFEEMVERGARVAVKPFRERSYELAFVKDPDGIWIEVLGRVKKRPRS